MWIIFFASYTQYKNPLPKTILCTLLHIVILYSVQEHHFIVPCYEKNSAFVVSLPNCDQSCSGRTHCLLFLVRFLCVSMNVCVRPCACVPSDLAYIFFQGCGSVLISSWSGSSIFSNCEFYSNFFRDLFKLIFSLFYSCCLEDYPLRFNIIKIIFFFSWEKMSEGTFIQKYLKKSSKFKCNFYTCMAVSGSSNSNECESGSATLFFLQNYHVFFAVMLHHWVSVLK
jgi:hypothetical protein